VRSQPDEDPAAQILVLGTLGAQQRHLFGRRGPRRAAAGATPRPVPVTRATVVETAAFTDAKEAAAWLRRLDLLAAAGRALTTVNRVVHAQRIAAHDPYVAERSLDDAIVIRAGYGKGEQVADGLWEAAVELPPAAHGESNRKRVVPASDARVAALLGCRDKALAVEELALRARADIDGGRLVAGALGVRLALEAAVGELAGDESLAKRVAELATLTADVDAAARAALEGSFSDEQAAACAHALRRIEAALLTRNIAR
jgi:hypothetical protein